MMIKYLEKNSWSTSKGTMVTSDSKTSLASKEDAPISASNTDDEDEINPFG